MSFETNNLKRTIWRAIDANINRTFEALRVVEDGLRFVLNDQCLTSVSKNLRHEFATWTRQFSREELLAIRDAGEDVGRSTSVTSEYHRKNIKEVFQANLSRAQQSLRALEEFCKVESVSPTSETAMQVERLRYRVYDLEKAVILLINSRSRLNDSKLYVLVDSCDGSIEAFRRRLNQLSDAGVNVIQLRDKSLVDRKLIEFSKVLVEVCKANNVISIVNDRADVALTVAADGVHLGQEDLGVKEVRAMAGPGLVIGVSTHNLVQARQATLDGANYVGVGPTFPSRTKHFTEFTGLDLLREVTAEISLPTFAIGGIDLQNVDEVLATGVHGIAVSGVIPQPPVTEGKLAEVVRALQSKLDSSDRNRSNVF